MTDIPTAREICKLVEGWEIMDGLSTVCIALIHLAATHGYSKDEALAAMSGQWDLYEKKQAKIDAKEKLN